MLGAEPLSPEVGRIVLVIGLLVAGVGALSMLGVRIPLGQLPGDIRIEGERGGIYIPLTTMLLISAVVTIILWALHR